MKKYMSVKTIQTAVLMLSAAGFISLSQAPKAQADTWYYNKDLAEGLVPPSVGNGTQNLQGKVFKTVNGATYQVKPNTVSTDMGSVLFIEPAAGPTTRVSGEQLMAFRPNGIATMQETLSMKGFYNGPIDGTYNSGTAAAVRNWQSSHGLPATGALDNLTLDSMGLRATPRLGTYNPLYP
jgi:hypothetical protein